MKKIVADFETSNWLENESYVWAWCTCNIDNTDELKIGNNIVTFFEYLKRQENPDVYMHNLRF